MGQKRRAVKKKIDFEGPKRQKTGKQIDKKNNRCKASTSRLPTKEESSGEDIICRCSPLLLVETLQKLNESQRKSVHQMGFGKLFHIGITEIPARIAYWCVKSYDPESRILMMNNKSIIHVSDEDVWLTLGIPKGPNLVVSKGRRSVSPMLDAWVARMGRSRWSILTKHVQDVLLSEVDGGQWFKIHFLVLVECCIFENSADGYVKPKIMDNLVDIAGVNNFNWCAHLITCLKKQHECWKNSKVNKFNGPILFLVALYIDRVIHIERTVKRCFPVVRGWDSNLIRIRQRSEIDSGGFGHGIVDSIFEPHLESSIDPVEELYVESEINHNLRDEEPEETESNGVVGKSPKSMDEESDINDIDGEVGKGQISMDEEPNKNVSEAEVFTNKFIATAQLMANTISDMIKMINDAPTHIRENDCFKVAVEKSKHLLGLTHTPTPVASTIPGTAISCTQAEMEELWKNPEWLHALEQMCAAMDARTSLAQSNVLPSFSLGLTQMMQTQVNARESYKVQSTPVSNAASLSRDNVNDTVYSVMKDLNATDFGEDETVTENIAINDKKKEVSNKATVPAEMANGKGKITVKQTKKSEASHAMVTRNGMEKKLSTKLLSPYNIRVVSPLEKLDSEERELYYWALTDKTIERYELMYSDGSVTMLKYDVMTLAPDTYLKSAVIDAWSSHLNYLENYRSPDSHSRFYFTTYPCSFTVANTHAAWTIDQRQKAFLDRIDGEIACQKGFKFSSIDLVFFPIYHSCHFYVFCFNMKYHKVVLLDDPSAKDGDELSVNNGVIPQILVDWFSKYLHNKGFDNKARGIKGAVIERFKLPWRNEAKKVDSGIYMMRNMETYMGQKVKEWKIGLKKNATKQLRFLRAKYCKALLASEVNDLNEDNVIKARKYYKLVCQRGPVEVEKFIVDYVRPCSS